jgi:PAS domain S-box-containing protein
MDREARFRQGARPMLLCDARGTVVDVNRAACLLLRLGRDEAVGLALNDLVLAPGRPALDEAIGRARARAGDGDDEAESAPATVALAMPDGPRVVADVRVASGGGEGGGRLDLLTLTFPSAREEPHAAPLLTRREREVLTQVALGRTGQLIAADLFLAHATVESHVSRALGKLGASNRPHGVALALRAGEIDPGAFAGAPGGPAAPATTRAVPADLQQVSIDAFDDPVAVLDEGGEVVTVNDAWRALARDHGLGTSEGPPAERLRAVYRGALGADGDAAEFEWGVQEILLGRSESFLLEYALPTPGGTRWLEARAARHAIGVPVRLAVRLHDLTSSRAALEVSDVGRSLLDELDVALVRTSLDGVVVSWRAGAEDLYGFTAAEAVGRPFTEVVRDDGDRDEMAESLRRVVADGRWAGPARICRRDGARIDVHVRMGLLHDVRGRPTGIVSVAVDVSAQVHAQRALRSTHERLRVVCEAMEEGVITLDPAGIVEDVNPAGARILGWDAAELRGKRVQDAVYAPEGAGTAFAVHHAGRGLRVDADRFVCHDGSVLPVSYVSAPYDAGDETSGTVIVFHDAADEERRRERAGPERSPAGMLRLLRDVLDDERLVLHAEPVAALRGGRVAWHELVPRIADGGGFVAASRFVPIAREHGLVRRIDRWMLEQAARLAAQGHAVEVRLSPESVTDPTYADVVRSTLAGAGADPILLAVAVPPSALRADPAQAAAFVRRIADVGCAPVLDDFGSGQAGLEHLRDLPWHAVKLDVGRVGGLRDHEGDRSIVRAFVGLAGGFRLLTVARGVEDHETQAMLVELGVELGQGDLIGTAEEVDAALRAAVQER